MKKSNKMIAVIIAIMFIVMNTVEIMPVLAENNELTDEQKNAMAMMNFITVLTQEINTSKNSRMYMEEAYSRLIDNTNPTAVDSRTLNQMNGLLDRLSNNERAKIQEQDKKNKSILTYKSKLYFSLYLFTISSTARFNASYSSSAERPYSLFI